MPRVTTGQFFGGWLNHAGGPNWTITNPSSRLFERKDSIVRPRGRFLPFEIDFHQRKTTSLEIIVHKCVTQTFYPCENHKIVSERSISSRTIYFKSFSPQIVLEVKGIY